MIEISKEEKLMINAFKSKFYLKFGYYPTISLEKPQQVIEEVKENKYVLSELKEKMQVFSPDIDLSDVSRVQRLVFLRKIFCMISSDYGNTLTSIGKILNRDHSTVIQNINSGYDLLETHDEFRDLYIQISTFINPKIYPHARINEVIEKEQDNSRPNHDSKLYARKYNVSRPDIKFGDKLGIPEDYKFGDREYRANRKSSVSSRRLF